MAKVKQNGQRENKESDENERSSEEQKKNQVKNNLLIAILTWLSRNPYPDFSVDVNLSRETMSNRFCAQTQYVQYNAQTECLTVILRTRVVHELIANEVHSTELT